MADWIDDAVSRTKQKFGDQQIADEKFVREESLKEELGWEFYGKLRQWFEDSATAFNTRYGSKIISIVVGPDYQTSVNSFLSQTDRRSAKLLYKLKTQQVVWSTGATDHTIQLTMNGDRGMLAQAGSESLTLEQLGQRIISGVLP